MGVGYPCDDHQDCDLDGSIECITGVCGASGATCFDNDDSKCLSELRCISNTCLPIRILGNTCDDDTDCVSGACIAEVCSFISGVGEPCDSAADCNGILSCSHDGTCGGANASCAFNNDILCYPPLACIEGMCKSLKADGASCVENDDCESTACIHTECARPSNAGEPCDLNESEDCISDVECIGVLCGGLGGSCINNNDSFCASNLRCIEGFCQAPSASNGSCDGDDSDCTASLVCIGLKCGDPSLAGGACDPGQNGDCNFGNCNDQGMCGGSGSNCGQDASCAVPLVCVVDQCSALRLDGQSCGENADCVNICVNSTCRAASEVGEPCDEHADCGGNVSCGDNFVCGGNQAACPGNDNGLCDAPAVVCLPSLTCGEPQPSGPCVDNDDCVNTCISGSCVDFSGAGEQCDVGDATDCESNIECSAIGICGSTGASCMNNNDSLCEIGLVCTSGTCNLPLVNGQPCAENSDCEQTCIGGNCSADAALGNMCDADDASDCSMENDCGDQSNPVCGGSGAACGPGDCIAPLVCLNSKCRGLTPNGSACFANEQCSSGVCMCVCLFSFLVCCWLAD